MELEEESTGSQKYQDLLNFKLLLGLGSMAMLLVLLNIILAVAGAFSLGLVIAALIALGATGKAYWDWRDKKLWISFIVAGCVFGAVVGAVYGLTQV
ncbi:hypothetical protein [Streptomyces sp.]|uniref:hypothetical protein n=1 Tax=Streptomyces sp. TaxID=1931 RepID=UPI0028109E16|nr:hypothetical protein [Streptomyces sp.]